MVSSLRSVTSMRTTTSAGCAVAAKLAIATLSAKNSEALADVSLGCLLPKILSRHTCPLSHLGAHDGTLAAGCKSVIYLRALP